MSAVQLTRPQVGGLSGRISHPTIWPVGRRSNSCPAGGSATNAESAPNQISIPLAHGKALGNPRNDDGADADFDALELGVLRHEDQVVLDGQAGHDRLVRESPAAHRDDVLRLEPGRNEAMVEPEGDVLVEQEPQEASLTAGGVWAARWAAYRRAATTWTRVSW